jgi:DNA-binding protein H-NS
MAAKIAAKNDAKGKVDLSKLSFSELRELARGVEGEIKMRREEDKKRIRQEIRELAASIGMTVEEVLGYGEEKKGKRKIPLEPKYRNPENPEQTWTGKGHRPAWVKEAVARGVRLEELKMG